MLHALIGAVLAAQLFVSDATTPQVLPALFPGRVLVAADITGHRLWFHLDTGTSGLAIDRSAAQDAGMRFDGPDAVADVTIGSLHADDARFSTLDHYGYSDGGVHVSGLIGSPFFTSNVVSIDYERHQLTVYPSGTFDPSKLGVAGTPIDFNGNVTFVHAWFGSKRATMLLDTGDQRTVLFSSFARGVVLGAPLSDPQTTTLGIGATPTTWREYTTAPLRFGTVEFANTTVYVADDPPAWMRTDALDGILGRDVLQAFHITLDYADNVIYLEH